MKALCPITGIPFRTYDSLRIMEEGRDVPWPVDHPVFSIPYDRLIMLLDDIRLQEEEMLNSYSKDAAILREYVNQAAAIKDLTNAANMAIHEKNWTNPAFKLYQTKHLVMLAFMKQAELLDVEKGYAARPKPQIIDSHFWHATEMFSWACTLSTEALRNRLPRYRVSRDNEGMDNIAEYLEIFNNVKTSIGNKFRDASTERKLAAWEMAISILTRRRDTLREKLSTSHNPLAAKWALTITNAPKQYWDFWYGILSSPSTKITFEGVRVGDRIEAVTRGDLQELYDHLDDNLVRPKGDVGTYHRDDSEFYFIARQTVLDIIRSHILTLDQGTSSYKIVNVAIGDEVLSMADDKLETEVVKIGHDPKPNFALYPKRIDLLRAMAAWRTSAKNTLLEHKQGPEVKLTPEEKGKYEIL